MSGAVCEWAIRQSPPATLHRGTFSRDPPDYLNNPCAIVAIPDERAVLSEHQIAGQVFVPKLILAKQQILQEMRAKIETIFAS